MKIVRHFGLAASLAGAMLLSSCEHDTRSFQVQGKVINPQTQEPLAGVPVDLGFYSEYGASGTNETDSQGNFNLNFETKWDEPVYLQVTEWGDFIGKRTISEEIKEEGITIKNIEFKPSTIIDLAFIIEQEPGLEYSISVTFFPNYSSQTFASTGEGDMHFPVKFGAVLDDNSFLLYELKYEARDPSQGSVIVDQLSLTDTVYVQDSSQPIKYEVEYRDSEDE